MVENKGEAWCILRTQGANTLLLAKALSDEGYRAWTPTEVLERRARRAIPASEVTVALMPGVVFADYGRLNEVIAASRSAMPWRQWDAEHRKMVVRGMPHFAVLRVGDRYARVADRELGGLRMAESVALTKAKRKSFKAADPVRMMNGSFEGMRGVIEGIKGDFATVRFAGWDWPVMIAFHLLEAPG